ncbi:hypothetical protein [Priestia aryabhattai]|uniref:hypothetical protein n=1 Tax=Priestia aryabhattai TaxID=412384 RepID=UPI003D273C8C
MNKRELKDEGIIIRNNYIMSNTQGYFSKKDQTLEERMEAIKLTDKEKSTIVGGKTKEVIIDKVLGLFPGGEIASTILNWNKEVDAEISEAKKAKLLEKFFEKSEQNELALTELKGFLTDPQGNVLFNKILRILDDYPPDLDLIEHLSKALKFIIEKDNFANLFSHHKFALAQIEKLTPQSLALLADHANFPEVKIGHTVAFGTKITSDWNTEFVNGYCNSKGITSDDVTKRVGHSITELTSQGYIEAHKVRENIIACNPTSIGEYILPYLGE